jgi:hypothetical protein
MHSACRMNETLDFFRSHSLHSLNRETFRTAPFNKQVTSLTSRNSAHGRGACHESMRTMYSVSCCSCAMPEAAAAPLAISARGGATRAPPCSAHPASIIAAVICSAGIPVKPAAAAGAIFVYALESRAMLRCRCAFVNCVSAAVVKGEKPPAEAAMKSNIPSYFRFQRYFPRSQTRPSSGSHLQCDGSRFHRKRALGLLRGAGVMGRMQWPVKGGWEALTGHSQRSN